MYTFLDGPLKNNTSKLSKSQHLSNYKYYAIINKKIIFILRKKIQKWLTVNNPAVKK